jgi:glutamine amidotransferase
MLEALRAKYGATYPENPLEIGRSIYELGNELGADGMFNFLLADGEHLFARGGDNLYYTERRAPFGHATLVDAELRVHFGDILGPDEDARMAVVATHPLTRDETWHKVAPGSLLVFSQGDLLHKFDPPPGYKAGSSIAPPWEPG